MKKCEIVLTKYSPVMILGGGLIVGFGMMSRLSLTAIENKKVDWSC